MFPNILKFSRYNLWLWILTDICPFIQDFDYPHKPNGVEKQSHILISKRVGNSRKIFRVRGVGTEIWECAILKKLSVSDITATLEHRYEIPPSQIKTDVEEVLVDLVDKKLLEIDE